MISSVQGVPEAIAIDSLETHLSPRFGISAPAHDFSDYNRKRSCSEITSSVSQHCFLRYTTYEVPHVQSFSTVIVLLNLVSYPDPLGGLKGGLGSRLTLTMHAASGRSVCQAKEAKDEMKREFIAKWL